jgi:hypothetical protein
MSENVGSVWKIDLSHLSSKELELLKQDMVASLDVVHDYLPTISETLGITGKAIEQVEKTGADFSSKDKSLLKLLKFFDEGIHKYLRETATRNEETHQLILSKESVKGKGSCRCFGIWHL